MMLDLDLPAIGPYDKTLYTWPQQVEHVPFQEDEVQVVVDLAMTTVADAFEVMWLPRSDGSAYAVGWLLRTCPHRTHIDMVMYPAFGELVRLR